VRYLIEREGRVRFAVPVREHHVELRLAPWHDDAQRLLSLTLQVDPVADLASHYDCFGNLVHRFALMGSHSQIATRLRAEVETLQTNPFKFDSLPPARERAWIADSLHQAPRLWDFVLHRSAFTPALRAFEQEIELPELESDSPLFAQVQSAMAWVHDLYQLDLDRQDPQPTLEGLLNARQGGAADLAHLLIAVVRGWGLPARYAIGYLDPGYFEPDEDEERDEPRPQVRHPWAEILIPGAGWRGFDPALGLLADETYVRVAVGRDATDVTVERSAYKGEAKGPDAQEVVLAVSRIA
jgi:transglutaminase-like putative cysteine protease